MNSRGVLSLIFVLACLIGLQAQHSVARQWNEVLLTGIRNDFARPTVHARNLFHTSMAMYESWTAYDSTSQHFFIGKTLRGFECPPIVPPEPADVRAAQEEAMSYAVYRIMRHRFAESPGVDTIYFAMDSLMNLLGYDPAFESTDFENDGPAAFGNFLGQQIIEFGLQDGANELGEYTNLIYEPQNQPLIPTEPGNPDIQYRNNWQPLGFETFIDQSGNVIPGAVPDFLSPEWGKVVPFSLTEDDLKINIRPEGEYWVYHDPGAPPYLDQKTGSGFDDNYKWGFTMVAVWQSHHDPEDGVMIDISPASSGNTPVELLPTDIQGQRDFYNYFEGGDPGTGRDINPHTGEPYEPQIVPRGDYARVLAEFWADGPDSETPPGHWFTILNYVHDHPDFERRYKGEGPVVDELEWDVKAYFALGGTMHDVAISAWGVKGWYDYVRPISAIRAMADAGQSTDENLPSYDFRGIPLIPGYVELIYEDDPLVGDNMEHLHKIKLYTWRGPAFIEDPDTSVAGVGWIRAEDWWPYQRPTFITPPFAGYVSGHSTYSRAAAEVLTLLTGDEYFPGGMGEFHAPKNEFLVFEDGPSQDITLQWATYRDASDQTSLSRIWGGIHPPADDIPGRWMGIDIGIEAFNYADCLFQVPELEADTLRFDCSPAIIEIPLEDDNVGDWVWESSDNFGIDGASNGQVSGPFLILDTLDVKTSTRETITYSIDGFVNTCQAKDREYFVIIENYQEPLAEFDAVIEDSLATFSNFSEGATDYFWDFGDGATDSTSNPVHKYSEVGEYTVQLIASNPCGRDTFQIMVQINSASAGVPATVGEYFAISPNPTNGKVVIDAGDLRGEAYVSVSTIDGRIVTTRKVLLSEMTQMDLSAVAPGLYFVIIEHESVRDVLKVVIE